METLQAMDTVQAMILAVGITLVITAVVLINVFRHYIKLVNSRVTQLIDAAEKFGQLTGRFAERAEQVIRDTQRHETTQELRAEEADRREREKPEQGGGT